MNELIVELPSTARFAANQTLSIVTAMKTKCRRYSM